MTKGTTEPMRDGGRFRLMLIMAAALLLLSGCALADTLEIPPGTTVIDEEAFYGDASLGRVVLPEGLERIESRAFACSSLTELYLPSSLTYIADDAFEGCDPDAAITAEEGSDAWYWGRTHGYCRIYTALLIGEESFTPATTRNRRDVEHMAAMLGCVYTPEMSRYRVTSKIDLTKSGIRDSIQSAFGSTEAQDVNLFFIATHGYHTQDGDLRTLDGRISFMELALWLNSSTRGKVIVILESCGAGSSIYTEGAGGESGEDADAFLARAVQAFAAADGGIQTNKPTGGARTKSTGDLRVECKFYVLAAAEHQELSWGYEDRVVNGEVTREGGNYFTNWLLKGIGTSRQASPADTSPADGLLTLRELYTYVSQYNNTPIRSGGIDHYQHVQAYPTEGTGFEYAFFRYP